MIDMGLLVSMVMALAPKADPETIEAAVQDWLDDHPEATTTVADGSITEAKLASALAQKVNQVSSLSDEIAEIDTILLGTDNINNVSLWKRQTIGNGSGSRQIGTTSKRYETSSTRLSTNPIIQTVSGQTITVTPQEGYKFYLFFFNAAVSAVTTDSGWKTTGQVYTPNNGYMAIAFAKIDDATITLDDYNKLAIEISSNDGRIVNIENRVYNLENPLPEYWQTYFAGKAQELENADSALGFDGVSFAFVTDIHVNNNNKMSPALLKYITNNTSIRDVVCGGDYVTNYSTKAIAIEELRWWADNTSGLKIVNLHGNHDGNSNNQTDNTQIISDAEFYGLCCRQTEGYINWQHNRLYGYSDNTNQKTRYIYLDTGAPDSAVINSEQLTWMQNRITELESGWFVVVFCHQFWTGASKSTSTLNLDANGTAILNALNEIYDIANATICAVITGHCHRNYSMVSEKGFPVIATTCDTSSTGSSTYDPDTPNRTLGTTGEQVIDLFYVNTSARTIDIIRIGDGDTEQDRSFTF